MTTRTELLELITNGENSGVEFKRDVLQNHDLAKELVAFSNLEGGMVLLGVDDDRSIVGLTRDRLEQWVMSACRDKIRPAIIPFFEVIRNVEPGKDVAVVRVPRGLDVHSQWHNNRNTYYIRVGTQSREPTPQELSRLFQQRGTFRADLRPVSGAAINDLDRRRLKDYFGRVRQQEVPADDDEAGWQTLLVNTEIMVEEGVTLSGMLLFGKVPNRFLPQAGIDAAAFPGTEKDYAAKQRMVLRGPMTPLLDQDGNVLEAGLVEQAVDFVRRNTPATAVLENGARRVEKPTYPAEAIREAAVNALIHRDYLLSNTDIELVIYQDRVEIVSPGKLPNGITPERMRAGTRAARNQLLKDVMRDYGYLEHMGMGVPRKIVRGMKKHNGSDPDLIEEGERFLVRLFAGNPSLP
jgi:ATP-dependent DNA helicase RecG